MTRQIRGYSLITQFYAKVLYSTDARQESLPLVPVGMCGGANKTKKVICIGMIICSLKAEFLSDLLLLYVILLRASTTAISTHGSQHISYIHHVPSPKAGYLRTVEQGGNTTR